MCLSSSSPAKALRIGHQKGGALNNDLDYVMSPNDIGDEEEALQIAVIKKQSKGYKKEVRYVACDSTRRRKFKHLAMIWLSYPCLVHKSLILYTYQIRLVISDFKGDFMLYLDFGQPIIVGQVYLWS